LIRELVANLICCIHFISLLILVLLLLLFFCHRFEHHIFLKQGLTNKLSDLWFSQDWGNPELGSRFTSKTWWSQEFYQPWSTCAEAVVQWIPRERSTQRKQIDEGEREVHRLLHAWEFLLQIESLRLERWLRGIGEGEKTHSPCKHRPGSKLQECDERVDNPVG
jgi:hypothetical protein